MSNGNPIIRRLLSDFGRAAAALLAAALTTGSLAQEAFPSRPLKMVLPLPPGGGVDVLARLIADRMSAGLGQPVIVDNRPGANGMIAAAAVAKSLPDGYTIYITASSIVQNPALYPNMPYKTEELAPVAQVTVFPSAFAVNSTSKIDTLAEFLALARAKRNDVSFGTWGIGSAGHFYGEILNRAAQIEMLHVPYKGEAPAIADLLAERVTSVFGSPGILAPHAKGGRLRILAVTAPRRLSAYPDIPTFSELGVSTLNLSGWGGVFAPAATPKPVLDRLAAEVVRVVRLPDVSNKITELGWEPTPLSGEPFAAFFKAELARWVALVKETGIKPQ